MRGKLTRLGLKGNELRITPAGAGKTNFLDTYPRAIEDHPRRCGENLNVRSYVSLYLGSPPRMRGKRIRTFASFEPVRITPADAGKTRNKELSENRYKDHPRGCGENS